MKKPKPEINKLHDILNFRPTKDFFQMYVKSDPRRTAIHPQIAKHFNVILRHKAIYQNPDSKHVLCNGTGGMKMLQEFVENSDQDFEKLVCMGFDKRLGECLKILQSVRDRFNKIYFEAKNIECDWVQTMPMGVNTSYLKRAGIKNVLQQLDENKNNPKNKLIASAYGSRWPVINNRIKDRKDLGIFTRKSDVIDDMFCPPHEYYGKLCEYRFFACPMGLGVQTPKICESIMCKTVPVVTDHVIHRELRDIYNLPLLIVKKWGFLTKEFLNEQWESKYSKIDWQKEQKKFNVHNFSVFLNK